MNEGFSLNNFIRETNEESKEILKLLDKADEPEFRNNNSIQHQLRKLRKFNKKNTFTQIVKKDTPLPSEYIKKLNGRFYNNAEAKDMISSAIYSTILNAHKHSVYAFENDMSLEEMKRKGNAQGQRILVLGEQWHMFEEMYKYVFSEVYQDNEIKRNVPFISVDAKALAVTEDEGGLTIHSLIKKLAAQTFGSIFSFVCSTIYIRNVDALFIKTDDNKTNLHNAAIISELVSAMLGEKTYEVDIKYFGTRMDSSCINFVISGEFSHLQSAAKFRNFKRKPSSFSALSTGKLIRLGIDKSLLECMTGICHMDDMNYEFIKKEITSQYCSPFGMLLDKSRSGITQSNFVQTIIDTKIIDSIAKDVYRKKISSTDIEQYVRGLLSVTLAKGNNDAHKGCHLLISGERIYDKKLNYLMPHKCWNLDVLNNKKAYEVIKLLQSANFFNDKSCQKMEEVISSYNFNQQLDAKMKNGSLFPKSYVPIDNGIFILLEIKPKSFIYARITKRFGKYKVEVLNKSQKLVNLYSDSTKSKYVSGNKLAEILSEVK